MFSTINPVAKQHIIYIDVKNLEVNYFISFFFFLYHYTDFSMDDFKNVFFLLILISKCLFVYV